MAKTAKLATKTSIPDPKTRTFRTSIDLAPDVRQSCISLLNARLADTFDLYSQLKQAHWNVKGMDFIQLHELFDEVAERTLVYVDDIAHPRACPSTRPKLRTELSTSKRSWNAWRCTVRLSASASTKAKSWKTRTPLTCSRKSAAPWTRICGF